jgi:RNA polymerase sigma-70 factor (ECF subfamily)
VIDRQEYSRWLRIARRHARRRGEAEDLLHDALLAAVGAGRRSLADPQARAWFAGVIRNKAVMAARSAARRRARETSVVPQPEPPVAESLGDGDRQALLAVVRRLPRAARAVATLAVHGMTREEIAYVLGLSQAALRQRLMTIRKGMADLCGQGELAIHPRRVRDALVSKELDVGLMRRALRTLLQSSYKTGIGLHDPDGHLIVFDG